MNQNQAIQMAAGLANQGKFAEAQKACQDILAANNKFHPAYHLLSQLAFQGGRSDIATQMLNNAVALDPNRATYHRDLAEVLFHSTRIKEAFSTINRALALDNKDPKSHFIAGLALMTNGEQPEAIKAFETTIKLAPNFGPAYNNLGSLMEAAGKVSDAKAHYQVAIKIDCKNAQAQTNLASIMIAQGDLEQAKKHLLAAIKARPDHIEAHHNLSGIKKYKKNDEDLQILKQIAKDPSRLSPINQVRLYFVLGKAYADILDHDQAFQYYNQGNAKMRSGLDYDETSAAAFNEALITVFDEEYVSGPQISDNNDPTPVFIVGMPRSGSTLVEQIIAGHSDVYAAGELTTLGTIIKSKVENFPHGLEALSDRELNSIGQDYLAEIKKVAPNAKRIIDKMPGNYRFVGLISKILPGAHVIHTQRSAMDCCLSIYTRLFLEPLHYAYDMAELGRYYTLYQDLMKHWQAVLSEERMTDVKYEDVVVDLEGEARRLIKFIGLDWQEAVLEFHSQKGAVKTASAAQVRKPIYKTSIERWKPYEKNLEPLIKSLRYKK